MCKSRDIQSFGRDSGVTAAPGQCPSIHSLHCLSQLSKAQVSLGHSQHLRCPWDTFPAPSPAAPGKYFHPHAPGRNIQAVKCHSCPCRRLILPHCSTPPPPLQSREFFFWVSLLVTAFRALQGTLSVDFPPPDGGNCSFPASHFGVGPCQGKPRCCWVLVGDPGRSLPCESGETQSPQHGCSQGRVANCSDKT